VGNTYYLSMYDTPTKKTLSEALAQGSDSVTFDWLAY
jgi:hypothetical protein